MVRIERHMKVFRLRNMGELSGWTPDGQIAAVGEFLTDGKSIYVEAPSNRVERPVRLMMELPSNEGVHNVCRDKVYYIRRGDQHTLFVGEDSVHGHRDVSLELHGFKVDTVLDMITKEIVDAKA